MYTSLYGTECTVSEFECEYTVHCTALHCTALYVECVTHVGVGAAVGRTPAAEPLRSAPRRAEPHERECSAVQCSAAAESESRVELSRLDLQLSVRSSRNESNVAEPLTQVVPLGSRLSLTLTRSRSRSAELHLTSTVTLLHCQIERGQYMHMHMHMFCTLTAQYTMTCVPFALFYCSRHRVLELERIEERIGSDREHSFSRIDWQRSMNTICGLPVALH